MKDLLIVIAFGVAVGSTAALVTLKPCPKPVEVWTQSKDGVLKPMPHKP